MGCLIRSEAGLIGRKFVLTRLTGGIIDASGVVRPGSWGGCSDGCRGWSGDMTWGWKDAGSDGGGGGA